MKETYRPSYPFHAEAIDTVLSILESSLSGLSNDEVKTRLNRYGENRLPERKTKSQLRKFLEQFNNILIYVLIGSAGVTAYLGHLLDTWIIAGVVIINAVIGYIQEGKAEKALDAVRNMLSLSAAVLREGTRGEIDAKGLVPGDLVLLNSGSKVPADLRILEAKELRIDEASLTGESEAVLKTTDPVEEQAGLGDRFSVAYSGTFVVSGQGTGIVTATGEDTEIGKINTMIEDVKDLSTPLLRQVNRFGILLAFMILAVSALVFLFGYFARKMELADIFLAVVGIAVASIPEGLPAVMTVALAIGVQRMAARHAIIRRLPAVETLGAVSVICTDKTGTLTRGEMSATRIILSEESLEVTGSGYNPEGGFRSGGKDIEPGGVLESLIRAAVACNDSALRNRDGEWVIEGLPTEGALLVMGEKAGVKPDDLERGWKRLDSIPFESAHKYMATLHTGAGGNVVFLKGAPEAVLFRCDTEVHEHDPSRPLDRTHWEAEAAKLADSGFRVLALARRDAGAAEGTLEHSSVENGMSLLGLVGIQDPPREEAVRAVAECREAGIRVKMITGDHALTARSVGAALGIGDGETVMTGDEIEAATDEELAGAADRVDVFARVSPEHKLRLVTALQSDGRVVAMTGDGVNDAPALKQADIGIAMGIKGTEAAKEAARMVLADDNFSSIVNAVEEGRTVYDNLKKTLLFMLPTNGGEAFVIITAILFGLLLPITPAQILWVNMVTSVTLSLALVFEPMEPGVMSSPPRKAGEPLVSGALLVKICTVTFLLSVLTLGLFFWYLNRGSTVTFSRTVAVNALILGEVFYLFSSRRISASSFSLEGLTATKYVWGTVLLVILLQMPFTYLPAFNSWFGTAPIGIPEWLLLTAGAFMLFLVVELLKLATRHLPGHREEALHLEGEPHPG